MLDYSDVQGNILRGYSHSFARFAFLQFDNSQRARAWLAASVGQVTTAENWDGSRPSSTFNVAFSPAGLAQFGVNQAVIDAFSQEFREGMAARASLLSDIGRSAPEQWEHGLGTTTARGIHTAICVYGDTPVDVDARFAAVLSTTATGVSVIYAKDARVLPGNLEHFGFRDDISNPTIEGEPPRRNDGGGLISSNGAEQPVALGEFIFGYPGQGGLTYAHPPAPFDRNGTYVVFRKLYQDVAAFRAYVVSSAVHLRLDSEWLAARMVGRWRDGTPLVLSPSAPDPAISGDPTRINRFGYASDASGLGCPIGAHIRRANPRDALTGGLGAVEGHRILRRGISYGDPLPDGAPEDGADRGLLFVSCGVSLREQFEFVQRIWLNDSGFTGTLDPAQKDPLVGSNGGQGTMTIPMSGFPRRLQSLPDFVTLRFGIYLYAPSIQALHHLSS